MKPPVFGFLIFTAGDYEGAAVRDTRLANALHRRGYKVVIYWFMETNARMVDAGITQRYFVRGGRYLGSKPSRAMEILGGILQRLYPRKRRLRFLQEHPDFNSSLLGHLVVSMCDAKDDPGPAIRLEKLMARDGVTHLMPTFVMTCPIALEAKERGRHRFEYLATFQGEEIFANAAQERGRLADYYAMLRRCVAGSAWPAIAVSNDYASRIREEVGIDPERLKTIYPGIEMPEAGPKPGFSILQKILPGIDPKRPIVSYLGRQDSEKGIDLLLYATKILRDQGLDFQLVICGGTSFGRRYHDACKAIADHLRLGIYWKRKVSDEFRAALYSYSRCVVYPSIHREPFGLVAAEAMSCGAPVIVPDHGGVGEMIGSGDCAGGLMFRAWDSRDLADQIGRMVSDDELHARVAANTRKLAANFDVEAMADRVLEHMGVTKKVESLVVSCA